MAKIQPSLNNMNAPAPTRRFGIKQMGPSTTLAVFAILLIAGHFSGGVWAIGGIALATLLAFASVVSERKMPKPDPCLLAIALLALTWMAASIGWSVSPNISIHKCVRLATVFLPLILLTSPNIKAKANSVFIFPVIALTIMIGALALGMELKLGGPMQELLHHGEVELTKYNRGLTYVILLAFPVMAWIKSNGSAFPFPASSRTPRFKRSEIMLALFILALLFPASLTESSSGKLALIVGLAITLAASLGPVLVTRILMVLPATLVAWPYAARSLFVKFHDHLDILPASWHHRMEIWDYMSWRILEKPWLGWGLGTSHVLPFQEPNGALYEYAINAAAHPHNAVTELWVELGLPGLALGIIFAYWALKKATRLPPAIIPFALGGWAAALCLSLIAYDFWTDSLFAAFALTGFAFSLLDHNRKDCIQNARRRPL
ncbi:MAG: O-antigen ligase family protein [Bdellovibrionales bacterium]